MPAYKRQHYLPTGYLKNFSVDQQNCNRDSLVWRLDRKDIRCVPVASQCYADYFYSKQKPADTEKMFQVNEKAYCDCIDKVRLGQEPEGRNRGDLLLAMFDFHLRNAVHKNQIGKEGIEVAFDKRVLKVVGNQANSRDVGGLNVGQMQNAELSIYMAQQLSNEQMAIAQAHLARKSGSPCEVNEVGWKLVFQYLPSENHFSFIRMHPPLM